MSMANCGQAFPYNTLEGCKVKEYNAICPLTNIATPITEYRITNADRIRAMSDEELASWAKKQIGCGAGFFPCGVVCNNKCETHSPEECRTRIMEWLKQPTDPPKGENK